MPANYRTIAYAVEFVENLITKKKTWNIRPVWQRNSVWLTGAKNALFDTLLLDLPIPEMTIGDVPNSAVHEVIDGQQRLTTIVDYMGNSFPLRLNKTKFALAEKMHIYKEFNGKYYRDLSDVSSAVINNYELRFVVMANTTTTVNLNQQIFQALNNGSTNLNSDEVKNCTLSGQYMELLKELGNLPAYVNMLGERRVLRMQSNTTINRFFYHQNHGYAQSPLPNRMCRMDALIIHQNAHMTPQDRQTFIDLYTDCIGMCKEVFLDKAFMVSSNAFGASANTSNNAIFETLMQGFVPYRHMRKAITNNKVGILAAFNELRQNKLFNDTFASRSNSFKSINVLRRNLLWNDALAAVVPIVASTKRLFTLEDKAAKFAISKICAHPDCLQPINCLEDAHGDHIIPYSKGGLTVIENLQLMHKRCNSSKGARIM